MKKIFAILFLMFLSVFAVMWLMFFLKPYFIAKTYDSSLVFNVLWPNHNLYIPFNNGNSIIVNRGLSFNSQRERLLIVGKDDAYFDEFAVSGKEGIFWSHRTEELSPIIIKWENFDDLKEEQRQEIYPSSSIVRIQKISKGSSGHGEEVKEFLMNGDLYIQDSNDKFILGKRVSVNKGKNFSNLVLIGLEDGFIFEAPFKNRKLEPIAMKDDKVVYIDETDTSRKLYFYSIADKYEKLITVLNKPNISSFRMQKNTLVWSDIVGHSRDVFCYDFDKLLMSLLVGGEGDQDFPFVFKDWIFWVDSKDGQKFTIDVKNIINGQKKTIVSSVNSPIFPVYFDGKLFWSDYVDSLLAKTFNYNGMQSYLYQKPIDLESMGH
jgi:translation elongation factor P/translation initiation factor 5A